MSILIKSMEMPMNCWFCDVKSWDCSEYVCPFDGQEIHSGDAKRHKNCPLIEVPDHGDLIDRDALFATIPSEEPLSRNAVIYAPIVIPAERSEDERE